jgi:hypothetical protein
LSKQARRRIIDRNAEAHLAALACSGEPAGHKRWTLRILAGKLVALGCVEEVSHETIRQVKKTKSNPGSGWSGAFRQNKTPNSWRTWRTCLMFIKEAYQLVKSIAPEIPVLQCLNNPKDVSVLAGFADIWDVYPAQYHVSGVAEPQKQGDRL